MRYLIHAKQSRFAHDLALVPPIRRDQFAHDLDPASVRPTLLLAFNWFSRFGWTNLPAAVHG
jgi:hypothetical protein